MFFNGIPGGGQKLRKLEKEVSEKFTSTVMHSRKNTKKGRLSEGFLAAVHHLFPEPEQQVFPKWKTFDVLPDGIRGHIIILVPEHCPKEYFWEKDEDEFFIQTHTFGNQWLFDKPYKEWKWMYKEEFQTLLNLGI